MLELYAHRGVAEIELSKKGLALRLHQVSPLSQAKCKSNGVNPIRKISGADETMGRGVVEVCAGAPFPNMAILVSVTPIAADRQQRNAALLYCGFYDQYTSLGRYSRMAHLSSHLGEDG